MHSKAATTRVKSTPAQMDGLFPKSKAALERTAAAQDARLSIDNKAE